MYCHALLNAVPLGEVSRNVSAVRQSVRSFGFICPERKAPCGLRGERIDSLRFLAGCRKRRLNYTVCSVI